MNPATQAMEGNAPAPVLYMALERFKMPASVRVVSCYEAGRDGFWLHRHLVSIGLCVDSQNRTYDVLVK